MNNDAKRIHQQDVDGCNYTMSVINDFENRIDDWSHTTGTYDGYDMTWTCHRTDGREYKAQVENKDRRWKWKVITEPETKEEIMVQDLDSPQYLEDYPSQMLEVHKYENMMEMHRKTGISQIYTAGYQNGIWISDVTRYPKDKVNTYQKDGGWRVKVKIAETTMKAGSRMVERDRILVPNNWGKTLKLYDKQRDSGHLS